MSKFSDSTFYLAPSGYRETILFPQKPLSPIGHLSVGRASSATRTNPAGQIEEVCYNLFRYSEDFSNAVWSKALGTFTTNTTVAPDGNLTADTFTKTSAVNTVSTVDSTLTTYSNTGIYTLSVYIKPIVGNSILLRLDSSGNTANASFNFTTKTFLNSGANIISSSYQELPNGWFRLSITGNVLNTSWISSICNLFSNPTNDAMAIWGAQLVQGNLPKDYLYTSDRLNFPRVDYSLGTGTFLLEPQRTNLDPNSQTFTGWILDNSGGTTATTVSASNPYGFSTVAKIIPDATLGQHRPFLSANYSAAGRIWVIAKSAGYDYLSLGEGGGLGGATIIFNLSNGTISGTAGGYAGEISSLGNGWYKCSLNMNSTGSASRFIVVRNANSTADYTGDGTSGILIAHKQLEVGAYDTTSILTSGATVTRIADSFSRGNIFTNNLVSSSGGTWFVEFKNNLSLTGDGGGDWISLTDSGGTSGNGLRFYNPPSLSRMIIYKIISSTGTPLFTTTTDSVKVAIKWNGSNADVFVNGIKQVSATAFTFTAMQVLSTGITAVPKFIQQMALWNTALTDAQCTDLTL